MVLLRNRVSRPLLIIAAMATSIFPGISHAASSGDASQLGIVSTIGIAIVTASLMTIIFNRFKLPALLAYIISGLLIGFFASDIFGESVHLLDEISHVGLVFLLFIIGMEMDPTAVRMMGVRTAIAITLQAPVTIVVIYALQAGLYKFDITLPGLATNPDGWIFYAVAVSLGSTAVVVKLLGDKFDLGSRAGRITIVTLIIEDIWAVLALSYVKSQGGDVDSNALWMMVGGGIILTLAAILVARYALSRVLSHLSSSSDILMLISLGWCFLCAELFSQLGLSAEIGALIAGLTIGRLPEHTEVFSKVQSLKDFFMALFFVALGISLPPPTLEIMWQSTALVVIIILARLLLYSPLLLFARQGPVVSFAVSINLSQISVFSLLLLSAGMATGALQEHDKMVISYAMLISVIISVFTLLNNYKLAMKITSLLRFNVDKHFSHTNDKASNNHEAADVIVLGLHVNSEAIIRHLEKNRPELLDKILFIDFNLEKHKQDRFRNLRLAYGDFSNPDTLRYYGIEHAKVVVTTLNNAFQHGIRNEDLIAEIKKLNPSVKIITTCLGSDQYESLLEMGAYACVSTPDESAPAYTQAIIEAIAASSPVSKNDAKPKPVIES